MQYKGKGKGNIIILICLLLLVLIMVLLVEKTEWGVFCGAVAILYAILLGKSNKE
jgi:hypothetical protein